MEELPDSEFDRLFREKSTSFDYSFEEDAWGLMERKLRRRDRYVFIRNTSAVFLLLLLLGGGIYLLQPETTSVKLAKKPGKTEVKVPEQATEQLAGEPGRKKLVSSRPDATQAEQQYTNTQMSNRKLHGSPKGALASAISDQKAENGGFRAKGKNELLKPSENSPGKQTFYVGETSTSGFGASVNPSDISLLGTIDQFETEEFKAASLPEINTSSATESPAVEIKDPIFSARKIRLSFSLSAGPDFSSVNSIAGKKANLNTGLLFNASFKKYTLSTGVRYGVKDYTAESYNYNIGNPARASLITGIDGSCNILELPLQLSYRVFSDRKKKIDLRSGISSYLMLKEAYLFKYSAQSGYKDYLLEVKNENQHYFSVIDLGASYQFKPVSSQVSIAIQPYVKIPLGGVGAGDVKLKSSGISLNLTYELSKTH